MMHKMNEVMNYIEEHLEEELELETTVPKMTGESLAQFKKIFLFVSNFSLLEYIRKRRLTLAGYDLRERKMRVIDVAVKYGYSSPDSFAKAFYKFHQVTPSAVYEQGVQIKSFAAVHFQITMSGGTPMKYRIEEKEAFTVVGLKQQLPLITEGEHKDLNALRESIDYNIFDKLDRLNNVTPYGWYNAVYDISEIGDGEALYCKVILGTLTTKSDTLGLNYLPVPKSTWAVFTSKENDQRHLQEIWKKIYTEWLPSSEYTLCDKKPNIFFMENDGLDNPDVRKEIWIPVKKFSK